jgi:hypothetical protein
MLRALDRRSFRVALCAAGACVFATMATAQTSPTSPQRPAAQTRPALQATPARQTAKPAPAGPAGHQAALLGTFRDWNAYSSAVGRGKVCYALAEPKARTPVNLKDTKGYLFISTRTAERVKNEISLVMNFDLKEDVDHELVIGQTKVALVGKGQNLWIKNPAEEGRAIDAMRRGSELTVRGTSKRGNPTSDRYSLAGFSEAVDAAAKDCN